MRHAPGIALLGLLAHGCDGSFVIAYEPLPDAGPACGALCADDLPAFDDIRVEIRGDTALVSFAPVLGAVDYRIYPLPEPGAVERDASGRQVIRDAIYRCAGRRTVADRADEYGALFSESLITRDNGYTRDESEAKLGYVFTRAGKGRVPVVRLADPNGNGGYFNAEWIPPLYHEANSAEYVTDGAPRAQLLEQGFRDDGIAFYAPEQGDLSVYRIAYEPDAHQGSRVSFFFSDGPEYAARSTGDAARIQDLGERFSVLSSAEPDAVPLYRVSYRSGSTFDVLAAGEAAYQRVLHQGGPVTSLTWSGLRARSVLVIEALDAGCPFPNAYLGARQSELPPELQGVAGHYPVDTLDALRDAETGEVYVNGQHAPDNRPLPIARSLVEAVPRAPPAMDFSTSFDDPAEFAEMNVYQDETAIVYRNQRWSVEASACEGEPSFGTVLGQLFLGLPACRVSLVPRGFSSHVSRARFLHVRMASDLPSTARRYPQLLITSAHSPEVDEVPRVSDPVIHNRLGPLAVSELPGAESSIVVQTWYSFHEPQIQFCGQRGWGPTVRYPRANLYGYNAGEAVNRWLDEPWRPVPVVTDRAGFDRLVQLDVYASTERVYLFLDGIPTGCAILPPGQLPEGPVTVAFRALLDEPSKDEIAATEPGRVFERTYSQYHSDRRMDDFGIDLDVPEPAWDETRLPCGTRWYGGQLIED